MPFEVKNFRVDHRVAIVTGAAAGIGRATAELLADAGATVVVGDRDGQGAQDVADAIAASGKRAAPLSCDVTVDDDLDALVELAVARFGGIDILVNNAGGGGPKPFDMPMTDFEWAYRLNVFSLFRLTQLSVPHMRERGGGAVVNINSMAGENKNVNMAS